MVFLVTHITEYNYDDFVSYCHNIATLKPRSFEGQQLLDYHLEIEPIPVNISEGTDFFGNNITRFSIQELHKKLVVKTQSKVNRDVSSYQNSLFSDACRSISVSEAISELTKIDSETLYARQFMLESPLIRKVVNDIKEYASVSFSPNRSVFDASRELMERIYTDFEFLTGFTNVATPLNDVIKDRKGVCQDFAQVAIACIRAMGLPARYVSGYIETIPPPGKPKLVGADASHAWFSVYIPGYGWADFDPTNNQIPSDRHIVLAWGRDYFDVPPLKGVIYTNGKNSMKVSVDIHALL